MWNHAENSMKKLKRSISVFSLCAVESSLLKRPIFDKINSRNENAFFSMFPFCMWIMWTHTHTHTGFQLIDSAEWKIGVWLRHCIDENMWVVVLKQTDVWSNKISNYNLKVLIFVMRNSSSGKFTYIVALRNHHCWSHWGQKHYQISRPTSNHSVKMTTCALSV